MDGSGVESIDGVLLTITVTVRSGIQEVFVRKAWLAEGVEAGLHGWLLATVAPHLTGPTPARQTGPMIDVIAKGTVLASRLDQLLPPGSADVSLMIANTTLGVLDAEGWTNWTGIKKP